MIRRSKVTEVDLQLTPMLDLSFNLLAFFVMTFNPMPIEGQLSMSLLPASPQAQMEAATTESQEPNPEVPAELRTLTTTVHADARGNIGQVEVGDLEVHGLEQLRAKLKAVLGDESLPFDQALIQADPELRYEELIKVVDVFMTLDITKISFGQLSDIGSPAL